MSEPGGVVASEGETEPLRAARDWLARDGRVAHRHRRRHLGLGAGAGRRPDGDRGRRPFPGLGLRRLHRRRGHHRGGRSDRQRQAAHAGVRRRRRNRLERRPALRRHRCASTSSGSSGTAAASICSTRRSAPRQPRAASSSRRDLADGRREVFERGQAICPTTSPPASASAKSQLEETPDGEVFVHALVPPARIAGHRRHAHRAGPRRRSRRSPATR